MRFSLGLDLGQRRDPAALVIVESISAHRGVERAGSGQIHVRFGLCTLTVDTTGVLW